MRSRRSHGLVSAAVAAPTSVSVRAAAAIAVLSIVSLLLCPRPGAERSLHTEQRRDAGRKCRVSIRSIEPRYRGAPRGALCGAPRGALRDAQSGAPSGALSLARDVRLRRFGFVRGQARLAPQELLRLALRAFDMRMGLREKRMDPLPKPG